MTGQQDGKLWKAGKLSLSFSNSSSLLNFTQIANIRQGIQTDIELRLKDVKCFALVEAKLLWLPFPEGVEAPLPGNPEE